VRGQKSLSPEANLAASNEAIINLDKLTYAVKAETQA
jgi:hypothetical protein